MRIRRLHKTLSAAWKEILWPAGLISSCLILLAGCGQISAPSFVGLATNRALWNSQNLHSYTIHQTNACFCRYSGQTVAVRVDADTVTSVTLVSTGVAIEKQGWQTVPELFEYARQLLDAPDFKVTIRYDDRVGAPTFIGVECRPELADCGGGSTYQLVPQPG